MANTIIIKTKQINKKTKHKTVHKNYQTKMSKEDSIY